MINKLIFGKVALFDHRTAEMQKSLFALRGADTFSVETFDC
jgi:hypothetical protein